MGVVVTSGMGLGEVVTGSGGSAVSGIGSGGTVIGSGGTGTDFFEVVVVVDAVVGASGAGHGCRTLSNRLQGIATRCFI